MTQRRTLAVAVMVVACLAITRPAARAVSVVDWLDRYAAGRFEDVVRELGGDHDFEDILKQLKRDGPAWIAAKGEAGRARREIVAATFALEAARADQWYEWKWIQAQPVMAGSALAGNYQPLSVLYWRPPPLLIEWACELLRRRETPSPIERWWHLAALAVAQRSEDPQFLIGDTRIGLGAAASEIGNLQDEIKHIEHSRTRFPDERRFVLAMGIAADRDWEPEAAQAYSAVIDDQDVGGEAAMRLGAMEFRRRRDEGASRLFDRAETMTRDPYVVYLVRFFRGQMLERQGETRRAEAAYRGAAAAWPDGQAATMALATMIFRDGRRVEAQTLVGRMLLVEPPAFDPWREYIHADNRFWPRLVGHLRAEIQP